MKCTALYKNICVVCVRDFCMINVLFSYFAVTEKYREKWEHSLVFANDLIRSE